MSAKRRILFRGGYTYNEYPLNLEICERRIQAINDTKIKYLTVDEKVYEVASIDLNNETLLAIETDSNVSDVPESELWDLDDLSTAI